VLITGPFDDEVAGRLQRAGFDVIRRHANVTPDELEKTIQAVEAYVLGGSERVTAEVLERAADLRIVVFIGEQPETFMEPEAAEILAERGVPVESTPGVSTNAVAEMTCALMLSALRRVPFLVREVSAYRWPSVTGDELAGKTLGVYGMGKIGYTVVKRLQGFDPAQVLYSDIIVAQQAEADFGARRVALDELFRSSDVVSLHAPLTPETKGVIGEELLRSMKPTAVLVNAARAAIVDPAALKKALGEAWIACAAFDGYYIEGPEFINLTPKEDPYGLLDMPERFFVTSHQGFNTYDAVRKASEVAADKLISFFEQRGKQAA
jgi:phosphoglycerate dehydrogenase-like enzyme